jgi:hypothetical protein
MTGEMSSKEGELVVFRQADRAATPIQQVQQ